MMVGTEGRAEMEKETGSAGAVEAPAANAAAAQIDFLKVVVAAAEGHLRAGDTKAQIALAAFVLSWNPLLAMLHGVCRQGAAPWTTAVLAAVVVATILCYGRAVWPSSLPPSIGRPGLFFLLRGSVASPAELVARVAGARLAEELANEAIKLSALRERKTRTLKIAFASTILTYAVFLALLVPGMQC